MKKIVLFISVILFLLIHNSPMAYTEVINKLDGNNWKKWGEMEDVGKVIKKYFVFGFMLGSSFASIGGAPSMIGKEYDADNAQKVFDSYIGVTIKDGKLQEIEMKENFNREEVVLLIDFFLNRTRKNLSRYTLPKESNTGQFIEGLDKLYEDFKNRNIDLHNAIYVVKKQIEGASEEEIEAILQYLRADQKDLSKLKYKDKTGKIQITEFP